MLEIKALNHFYGAIHAIKDIDLTINKGEIVALIGGNGAGKTTTLRRISGLLDNKGDGQIIFQDKDINKTRAEKIAMLGISQVLEGRHIFAQLTVKENLIMGAFNKKVKVDEMIDHVYSLFPRLEEREKQKGGTLSGGEQQMLAVGRALMSDPEVLMMDEPSLGLAPIIVKEIFGIIKKINQQGKTILLVEQNSKAALNIAHRGYVIESGKICMSDSAENLLNNEEVKKSYLGEE
jgi:branched-chain amino acid transport system ATP-binding protein